MMTPEYRERVRPVNRQEAVDEGYDVERIEALVAEREAARAARDFARADRIRGELETMFIRVEDHRDEPTFWYIDHMRLWRADHARRSR